MNARTRKGELYKGKSLVSIRYALNRHLNKPPYCRNLNIIRDPDFTKSSNSFKTAMTEIKEDGKGDVENTPPITKEDLLKLYKSPLLDPETHTGLANKVQFDIRIYFFRRAQENMHTLTKDSFKIERGENGVRYIRKVGSEMLKNRREMDIENGPKPTMPATGGPRCPVASYEKYVSKLHPDCNRLFTKPLKNIESDHWYSSVPKGVNNLRVFMRKMSIEAGLSQIYSNHSIRATGLTALGHAQYSLVDICSVSNHKSITSLKTYQRTSLDRRLEFGNTISDHLENQQPGESSSNSSLRCTASKPSSKMPPPSATVTRESSAAVDLNSLDVDSFFDEENEPQDLSATASLTITGQKAAINALFSGCKIGSIGSLNIAINK